ncbi:unnamed protein product [Mytilus edulis]|uniref:Endonuclease/exonuclease/phosphatase domain-containing protein n=1 Tax=Mytilus edulis TaxID=6550 RepID=A0A8S3V7R5_MYTED|nr:unnamed protein product [Mytilus edulis]
MSGFWCVTCMHNDIEQNPGPNSSRYNYQNIQIAGINVNSLRYKTDLIHSELGECDVICVSETKLKANVGSTDLVMPNFYNPDLFRKDRSTDGGGGILIYVRDSLHCKRRSDLEIAELESVCVEITTKTGRFLVVCFYRPPNAPVTSLDHFENLLDNVIDTDKNVILLGDLNIDLLKASPTSRISRICERYGIENVVKEPTRITSSTATLLDPIYINNLSLLRNSMVLPSFCSDHFSTHIEIKLSTARQKAYSYFCSISRFDTEPQLPNVPPLAPYELSDIVITEQDVIDHFQILNINKPAGPEKLPPKFLKAIFPSLSATSKQANKKTILLPMKS